MEIEINQPQISSETSTKKPKKIKRPKATSTDGHFLRNADLYPEVMRAKQLGYVTDELAVMYIKMATRYISAKNFAHLPFKEDLIQNGVIALLANGLKFNEEKGTNAFSYFTTILYHSSLQMIAAEKKQRDIRDQLLVNEDFNGSLGFMESAKDAYRESHADFFLEE